MNILIEKEFFKFMLGDFFGKCIRSKVIWLYSHLSAAVVAFVSLVTHAEIAHITIDANSIIAIYTLTPVGSSQTWRSYYNGDCSGGEGEGGRVG